MKKRFIPVIPITVALLLMGGLAYALEKKWHAKPEEQLTDTIHEEEALQAELLAATDEPRINLPVKKTARSRAVETASPGSRKNTLKTNRNKDNQPKE